MSDESGQKVYSTCCVQCGAGMIRIPAAIVFPWGAEPVCSERCFLGAMRRARDVVLSSCRDGAFQRKELS